jgi:hypothetical protein
MSRHLTCGAAWQIEEHLGLAVPFTVVFEYPTIRQLAVHILYLLNTPEMLPIGTTPEKGVSLTALAEAAQQVQCAVGEPAPSCGSVLLSTAAKAGGVPCSPAQLYFVSLQQVHPSPWPH